MAKFLRIVEWEKFQHYKDRNPPWIKLHRELLTSNTWVELDDASRLLAIVCMVLASDTDNRIPLDGTFIQRRAYLKRRPDVRPLVAVGFAEIVEDKEVTEAASVLLADASTLRQIARPETEEEAEEEAEAIARPISIEQVVTYCSSRGKGVDGNKWFNYYSSNGWKVGRNPMKDWRAAVRTWENNDFGGGNGSKQQSSAQQPISKQQERSRNIAGSLLKSFAAHVTQGNVPDGGECEGGTGRTSEPGIPPRVRKATTSGH